MRGWGASTHVGWEQCKCVSDEPGLRERLGKLQIHKTLLVHFKLEPGVFFLIHVSFHQGLNFMQNICWCF